MFAKLENGQLIPAPKEFLIDVLLSEEPEPVYEKRRVVGFTEDFLLEQGYKPVKFTDPVEGTTDMYTETDTEIIQHWEVMKNEKK